MRQHPIPQNISSYQFRLIGDMTLKQFLELVAGVGIGFVFYSTNLIFPIKWFFVIISVIGGVAFAFMPLEGMPLDRWLIAFLKASYSPNQFVWKKSPDVPAFLKSSPQEIKSVSNDSSQNNSAGSPAPAPTSDQETDRINQLVNLFDSQSLINQPVSQPKAPPTPPTKKIISTKKTEITTPSFKVVPLKQVKISRKQEEEIKPAILDQPTNQPTPNQEIPTPEIVDPVTTVQGITNANLPFPSLPEKPNVLVGMVLDPDGKIIENAIIEMSDQSNIPVRATKTNKLGQFFSVTPLKNGQYVIKTDKPGFSFDIISITLSGKIYPPLEIRAKGISN